MADCIFCKILEHQIPSYVIYDDDATIAFLDVFPSTDGHVVVIHKRHEEKITGYSNEEVGRMFVTVQKVARAVEKTFGTKILSIGINHGEPKGVHHAHVHVLPRFEGDNGGIIQSLPKRKPKEKLEAVRKMIAAQIE